MEGRSAAMSGMAKTAFILGKTTGSINIEKRKLAPLPYKGIKSYLHTQSKAGRADVFFSSIVNIDY